MLFFCLKSFKQHGFITKIELKMSRLRGFGENFILDKRISENDKKQYVNLWLSQF